MFKARASTLVDQVAAEAIKAALPRCPRQLWLTPLVLAILLGDVIHDVVGMGGISAYSCANIMQVEPDSGAPTDVLIGILAHC